MKAYEKQLQVINQLQEHDKQLQEPIEVAYAGMMDKWDIFSERNKLQDEWTKLMEQSTELNKRINVHTETLTCYDGDDKIGWIGEDGLYMQHKYLNVREMDKLMTFLQLMNEEVA